jgi:hypothetical protein
MQKVANWLLDVSGIATTWEGLPAGVEVCQRSRDHGDHEAISIVINHTPGAQTVYMPHPLRDLLTGQIYERQIPLPPHGIAVLKAEAT